MLTIVLLLLFLAAVTVLAVWLKNVLTAHEAESSAQLAARNAEIDRRLQAVVETMDRRLGMLDGKVDRRLESASKTTSQIHERLGKVDEATGQMLERAKELSRLEQALRPPKARGGFGEVMLGNLLADQLPPHGYTLEYGFKGGERVDAVIRGGSKLVPVDSKFPFDNFERLVDAEDDTARELAEKAFGRDVRNQIDSIAAKYIRPDEGTYDFAFMYLPSESVWY